MRLDCRSLFAACAWLGLLVVAVPQSAWAQIWRQATPVNYGEDLQSAAERLRPGQYIWSGRQSWGASAGVSGMPVRLIVSTALQRLYVYQGDELIGAASVSTGARGKETPHGDFPILQKARHHRSNIYSNAPMPFMQRLTWTGIALHAGHNPGHPASHGCIRLPYAFARDLFALTRLGTQVAVTDLPDLPTSTGSRWTTGSGPIGAARRN
jgi:lipoprotein-anchoring transpeptidase ErfK/SrfK